MEDKRLDKVLEGIQDIKVAQAVQYEQITQLSKRMDNANSRIDKAESRISSTDNKINLTHAEIDKRLEAKISPIVSKLSMHDKIVGAVVLSSAILLMLIRLKLI